MTVSIWVVGEGKIKNFSQKKSKLYLIRISKASLILGNELNSFFAGIFCCFLIIDQITTMLLLRKPILDFLLIVYFDMCVAVSSTPLCAVRGKT